MIGNNDNEGGKRCYTVSTIPAILSGVKFRRIQSDQK
jgi:hypothetical protein